MTTFLLLSLSDDGTASLRRVRKCSDLTYRVEPPNGGTSRIQPSNVRPNGYKWRRAGFSIEVTTLPKGSGGYEIASEPLSSVLYTRTSPYPAFVVTVAFEDGRALRHFRKDSDMLDWMRKRGYELEAPDTWRHKASS